MVNPITLITSLVIPQSLAFVPLMVGMGVLGAMSAMNSQKGEQEDIGAKAKAHGIKMGGIDFSADRKAATFIGRASFIASSKINADMTIDKAMAQAASDAQVEAAASGVSGQSVNAVVNETSRTAAEAKDSVARRVQAEKLQLTTDYTDNYLNAAMQKGSVDFKERSSGNKGLGIALGFAQGFLGAM